MLLLLLLQLKAKLSTSSCKLQMSVIQSTLTHTPTLTHPGTPFGRQKWACSGVEFNTFLRSHIKCLTHIRPPAYELGAAGSSNVHGGSSSTGSRSCHCYFKGACCLSFDDHFKNIFLTSFCRSFSAKKPNKVLNISKRTADE